MTFKWTVLLLPFVATAYAGEHSTMEIKVIHDDGNGSVEFNSEDLGFDLMEMQVGENRSFVDKNGQSALITRTAEGFDLSVEGKTIQIPDPARLHDISDTAADVDVDVIRKKLLIKGAGESGAVIVTKDAVDASTQAQIRALLESAGVDGDVRFVEGGQHGEHMIKDVRIIRKETL